MIEERNKDFEKKMQKFKLFIDSLMKKNVRKETLLKSQKDKSNSYRTKTYQPKK